MHSVEEELDADVAERGDVLRDSPDKGLCAGMMHVDGRGDRRSRLGAALAVVVGGDAVKRDGRPVPAEDEDGQRGRERLQNVRQVALNGRISDLCQIREAGED